jgi:hypothetical protein
LSWCHSTGHGRARCERTAFAPKRSSLLAASAALSPADEVPSASSTCSAGKALAADRSGDRPAAGAVGEALAADAARVAGLVLA